MFFIHCCMLGFIHCQLLINLVQSKIRSIKALLFPKKIVFSVGKKRWQADKLFCDFWLCVGLCELQMCLAVSIGYLYLSIKSLKDSSPNLNLSSQNLRATFLCSFSNKKTIISLTSSFL